MSAGETRNYTTVLSLGAPGVWDNPEPAVASVLKPYAKFFADTYGEHEGFLLTFMVAK